MLAQIVAINGQIRPDQRGRAAVIGEQAGYLYAPGQSNTVTVTTR